MKAPKGQKVETWHMAVSNQGTQFTVRPHINKKKLQGHEGVHKKYECVNDQAQGGQWTFPRTIS